MKELYKIFFKTNQSIINVLSNKSNLGLNNIKEKRLLNTIHDVLDDMQNNCWNTAPNLFTKLFRFSKLDKKLRKLDLKNNEIKIVDRIVDMFMSNVLNSSINIYSNIKNTYKQSTKESNNINSNFIDIFTNNISNNGIIAFTDKSGRNWSMQAYSDMLIRTSSRMINNYGVLYTYEHIDLYKISKHGTTCKICAPLEGRVYSRSGTHPIYPPLASAFGKINKNGSNTLENSYLNIHPNCMHVLIPFTEEGYTKKELEKIQNFSNFQTNPVENDPRTKKQIESYRKKENGRIKLVNDFNEFQKMKLKLGNNMPKTFDTFQKHKLSNSLKYQGWVNMYKNAK